MCVHGASTRFKSIVALWPGSEKGWLASRLYRYYSRLYKSERAGQRRGYTGTIVGYTNPKGLASVEAIQILASGGHFLVFGGPGDFKMKTLAKSSSVVRSSTQPRFFMTLILVPGPPPWASQHESPPQ
jgi:hypothetical protein